jgi:polysaccharide export outer membrane protein
MKKNICQSIFLLLTVLFCLSSCIDKKQIAYFQKGINGSDTINIAKAYVPTIQPGDILSIPIGSLNPVASSFFNPYSAAPQSNTDNSSSSPSSLSGIIAPLTQPAAPGYLVSPSGTIDMPILGTIKIAGLSTSVARDTIKNRLKFYLKSPSVSVRFLNYKISVLGEVAHPAVYTIPNEEVTLPEALSMAGDMTIYGQRNNVMIIRDNNGKKEFGHVDLTSREVYSSPYYYLHANDVVYVEPGKGRIAESDKTYQILPIILSALSLISIIVLYSKK